jgi:uncharacterized protein YrrD
MVLYKLEDFDPNYRDTFGDEIKGYDVYADRTDEKIGTVKNILVDESGHFRYLVVDTGFWIFGKQVLLPVGRSSIDHNAQRIHALGFTKEQAENLPEFNDSLKLITIMKSGCGGFIVLRLQRHLWINRHL